MMKASHTTPLYSESSLRYVARKLGGRLSRTRYNGCWTLQDDYGNVVTYGYDLVEIRELLSYAARNRITDLREAAASCWPVAGEVPAVP